MENFYKNFENLYPVSKTLRFELRPQGKTLDWIEKRGIIEEDFKKSEDYKKLKKIIDGYHKAFIDKALCGFELDGLQEYYDLYNTKQKDDKIKDELKNKEEKLRKKIVRRFKNFPEYKTLTASTPKDLLKEKSSNMEESSEKDILHSFDGFATYFKGYQENRKNMYSDEEKSTAIAYRIVNQNLVKFINNMEVFTKIKVSRLSEKFDEITENLGFTLWDESIEDAFKMDYFNFTLTEKGITDYNSLISGIGTKDRTARINGLNNYINEYNQKLEKGEKKLPLLQPLFKQILSDDITLSFVYEKFEKDSDVFKAIKDFLYKKENSDDMNNIEIINAQYKIIKEMKAFDSNGIYVKNDKTLSTFSQKIFSRYDKFKVMWIDKYDDGFDEKKKKQKNYEKNRKNALEKIESFSLAELQTLVDEKDDEKEKTDILDIYIAKVEESYINYCEKIEKLNVFLSEDYSTRENSKDNALMQDEKAIQIIKEGLDGILAWNRLAGLISGSGKEIGKDYTFYGEFEPFQDRLSNITSLYNKVRNYLTKKSYSVEKFKLNFDRGTLLDGWDVNKESDNLGVLFMKDKNYYLGIMDKNNNKIFNDIEFKESENCYQKIEYKVLPGPNKMLPKVFFSNKNIEYFNPSDNILRIRKDETFKKGEKFNIKDCHDFIDFYKTAISRHPDWSKFDFHFKDTREYADISGFYKEVEQQGYKIRFKNISEEYINKQVEDGNLYLFQIYNKDFSTHSKGTPNLHTLYWKMLFDERNLKNPIYKLNGEAEIFYRKASLEKKVTHPANVPIERKNPNKKEGDENLKSQFVYDLYKDKRFMENKFQFHVPITLNFNNRGINRVNASVNQAIYETEDLNYIGIDRGERHLLYYSLIDCHGNIKEQGTLNEVKYDDKGVERCVNYNEKLKGREIENDKARKSWKTIKGIKDVKGGYLSQVVHKLTKLMVENNAILVMEDLNAGFINSRRKIERQVYHNFEKAMIDKLNYMVDKQLDAECDGGLLEAYQLTNKFESFKKMGKQNGVIFYVPAAYTSKIDPTTGFANFFYGDLLKYKNKETSKEFFSKFDSIKYNEKEGHFEFTFDYKNFTDRKVGSISKWTVCTNGERIKTFKNPENNKEWDNKCIPLTKEFKNLFQKFNVEYVENDLKKAIVDFEADNFKEFYETLTNLFRLTLQMRNSISNTETDYLISPVKNKNGYFYYSDEAKENEPKDADANGAYNIALKGLIMAQKIKAMSEDKVLNVKPKDLLITNEDWFNFVQNRNK